MQTFDIPWQGNDARIEDRGHTHPPLVEYTTKRRGTLAALEETLELGNDNNG